MMNWQEDGWLNSAVCLPSPNFGERPAGEPVSLVVVHNISLPPDEFGGDWVEKFFLNQLDPQAHPYFATIAEAQVSAHFYIRRDGRVIQFVGCDQRAWHAGRSQWCARENCNDYSVGIELEGRHPAIHRGAIHCLVDCDRCLAHPLSDRRHRRS
jgi:AmpD protein